MNVILDNLYKDYEGKIIFENISGRINKGEKIGLIGNNGVGKTTLANIIAGIEQNEKGNISFSPSSGKIVYLNQGFLEEESCLDIEALVKGYVKSYEALKNKEVKNLLAAFGLEGENMARAAKSLSGGEKTKLMLARTILQEYDLLILDEPTNHLDIETRALLEKLVISLRKTVLIISHDRYFLDKTIDKIWELSPGKLMEYSGNYTNFKLQREIEIRNNLKVYEKQQKTIEHLNEVINERKEWFTKAHKAARQNDFLRSKSKKHVSVMRSKERQLEKIEENKLEHPKEELYPYFDIINKNIINTKLPRYLIRVRKLNKSFGTRKVLEDVSVDILRGDKVGIIGRNGSGKTTMLKIVNGLDDEFEGEVSINPSIKIAYFSQQLETLDYEKSALDNLLLEGVTQTEARTLLANLLFKGNDVFKEVKVLSMGEKSRVAIARIILSGANLLILDEPTNYMDIISKEKIEEMLKNFRGSILFVSHDRYFINSVATKIFELEENKVNVYCGNYDFYEHKKGENELKALNGENYKGITDNITRLECELAFISGELSGNLEGEEKEQKNKRFIEVAREIKQYKEKLVQFNNN